MVSDAVATPLTNVVLISVTEKLHRDLDNLTPLSPRNSMLMANEDLKEKRVSVKGVSLHRASMDLYSERFPAVQSKHGRPEMCDGPGNSQYDKWMDRHPTIPFIGRAGR